LCASSIKETVNVNIPKLNVRGLNKHDNSKDRQYFARFWRPFRPIWLSKRKLHVGQSRHVARKGQISHDV